METTTSTSSFVIPLINYDLLFVSIMLLILVIVISLFIIYSYSVCGRYQNSCLSRIKRFFQGNRTHEVYTVNLNWIDDIDSPTQRYNFVLQSQEQNPTQTLPLHTLPVSRKIVKHTEKTNNDPDLECPICFEKIGDTSCFIGCDHAFHEDCIKKWIIEQQKTTCPICRSEVVTNTVTCF